MQDTIKNPEELCSKKFSKAFKILNMLEEHLGDTSFYLSDVRSYVPYDSKVNGIMKDIVIDMQKVFGSVSDLRERITKIKTDNNVENY